MTTQIAVRLPDDLVEFIDQLVQGKIATSRAAVVAEALRRERRRQAALRDIEILKNARPDTDADAQARWAAEQALDIE